MCDCQKNKRQVREGEVIDRMESETQKIGQIQLEIQKIGRKVYLQRISSAARKTLAQMPEQNEIEKLNGESRQFVERALVIITDALKASSWSDIRLMEFAQESSWAHLAASIGVVAMGLQAGGGGGSGKTCVTQCLDEYNKCMKENDCEYDSWFCLCCQPCMVQYLGCIARCVTSVGGFGGGIIIA
jgi:hypothetical protein